jgi:hypothetical protein
MLHHGVAELWLLFLVGESLHWLKRSDVSAGTRCNYFSANWRAILVRTFLGAAAFSYWLGHPDAITRALHMAHLNWEFTLLPDHATSSLFGFLADSGLDWLGAKVPIFRGEIPQLKKPEDQ